MVSFDAIVRQMTEMFQWPKCYSKKWPNVTAKKQKPWTTVLLSAELKN